MKSNDFIEFKINLNNTIPKVKELFLIIHKSNEFKIPTFGNVNHISDLGKINELSYLKTVVKHLPWPYKSDCHHLECKS